MTFVTRAIDLTIELGTGNFGASGQNTVTLRGLRVEAELSTVLLPGASTAILRIYGMTLSMINRLTVAGLQWTNRQNRILVQAGDAQTGMSTIFGGLICEAYPDFAGMPEAAFVVTAVVDQTIRLKPVPPVSYPGPVNAADVMKTLATNAGLTLENNGVSVMLPSSYFPGTTGEQIRRCAQAAGIFAYIDGTTKTLAIWPKGGSRGGTVPVISAATGMIGYPSYQQIKVVVKTLFNPLIRQGAQIKIESQLTPASGIWNVISIDYSLASQTVDGPWETVIGAINQTAPGA